MANFSAAINVSERQWRKMTMSRRWVGPILSRISSTRLRLILILKPHQQQDVSLLPCPFILPFFANMLPIFICQT